MTSLKTKLKKRHTTIGSWITIGSTVVAEIMAKADYEWLTVDMEHSAITLDIAQDMTPPMAANAMAKAYTTSESPNMSTAIIVPKISNPIHSAMVYAIAAPPLLPRAIALLRFPMQSRTTAAISIIVHFSSMFYKSFI